LKCRKTSKKSTFRKLKKRKSIIRCRGYGSRTLNSSGSARPTPIEPNSTIKRMISFLRNKLLSYYVKVINGFIIIKALICKIPPNLPLLKGGITPLCQRGVRGDFLMIMSIQF